MSDPALAGPNGAEPLNPLALASVVLGVLGIIVYCCGWVVCIHWLAFIVWLAGLVCGGVALAQGVSGNNKILAIVGIALNLSFGLILFGLFVLGFGVTALSSLLGASGY
jgi:hypothetical protein